MLPLLPPAPLADAERRAACPVVLVSMPFMDAHRPSIQLGLLGAIVRRAGFAVRTLHANLDFAARIGLEAYATIGEGQRQLLGEWLFAVEAFGKAAPDPEAVQLAEIAARLQRMGTPLELLKHIRDHEVPAYLDALVDDPIWTGVRVAGFSSTFQQNAASFALARRLKQRWPEIVTVFGGANFDGEMGLELVRAMECVDYAVIGEGDVAFPRLLDAIAAGADPAAIPGVARRTADGSVTGVPAPPTPNLDELPPPEYDEYFERAEALGVQPRAGHRDVWLPFESARGCWWGAKHHCTFCGLNGTSMAFRAKSPGRVRDELALLARRYRSFRFEAVDNILDVRYLKELFPDLVDDRSDYELFYEVKANLTREQLRLLAAAGVLRLQPGLESLSSPVLGLMRKGVRAVQNVNLLRWARYYGIEVTWNILWGFPGETAAEYASQAELVPQLAHLAPPEAFGRFWLGRFSPMFTDAESFGIHGVHADPGYRRVYPDTIDHDKIAYYFGHDQADKLDESTYAPLATAIEQWQQRWTGGDRPALTYWSAPGFLQIHDERVPGAEGTYTFEGDLAAIYLACSDRPMSAAVVHAAITPALTVAQVAEVCTEFARRGLLMLDGDQALALALPAIGGR
jgi:ribosomal peptide maturation radical SAM protein 1